MYLIKKISQHKQLLNNSIFAVLDNGVVAIFGLFYTIFMAQVLTKEEYGIVILFDVIRHICTIFMVALVQALVKYVAEKQDINSITSAAFLLLFMYLGICSTILILLSPKISSILHVPELAPLLQWLPLLLFLSVFYFIGQGVYWGLQKMHVVFLVDALFSFVFIISSLYMSKIGKLSTAQDVYWLFIIARFVSAIAAFIFTLFKVRFEKPKFINVHQLWRYIQPVFINSLGVLGYSRLDRLILGIFLSPIAVASYNAAAIVFNAFMLINQTMSMLLLPRASRESRNTSVENRNFTLRRFYVLSSVSFTILSLPFVLLLILAPEIIAEILYRGKYPEITSLLVIFALWGLTLPFSRAAASILNGVGKPQINAYITWFVLIISILLNALLIPIAGIFGAAISTLFVSLMSLGGYLLVMRKVFGLRISDFKLW